ncbi:hypothetical protein K0040_18885 [Terrisporobacter petrolearius]|uniref:cysteine peptidase family C39 domain-containing protein n=1 Tax=Terrisporobacter petrolearius TaxID=1460447 RepID=UPI001D161056|nr:cysteine peptidase family C39 domain-containing protein [Terrisporobacter petrolearius]MCC3866315.1 hypothetical protein [Terrisporobacter petrolearius]
MLQFKGVNVSKTIIAKEMKKPPNKNLHVMTVIGVDDDDFYITDPAKGKYSVCKTKFESIYNKIRKRL